jgi:hypothetical protein
MIALGFARLRNDRTFELTFPMTAPHFLDRRETYTRTFNARVEIDFRRYCREKSATILAQKRELHDGIVGEHR